MAFQSISDRIDALPTLIAGPLLRKVEATGIAVWFLFKEPVKVRLKLFADEQSLCEQESRTIALGPHFHVCCARVVCAESAPLKPGGLYQYDFEVELENGTHFGREEAVGPGVNLCIEGFDRPSFTMSPADINQVKLAYGSCRKPHGEGNDTLPHLAHVMDLVGEDTTQRPQQLYLMGDQIYADDVATPLLAVVGDVRQHLLPAEEILPLTEADQTGAGERLSIIGRAGFSSSFGHSHLLWMGEFFAMYALVWSPTLWPESLPTLEETTEITGGMTKKAAKQYPKQLKSIEHFRKGLGEVRRALANIPVYMIADDHEITDDWYLNRAWTHRVISNKLGRQLLTNGLCAYMVCQNWGNQPAYFEKGPAKRVLELTQKRIYNNCSEAEIAETEKLVGLPKDGVLPLGLTRDPSETCLLHFRVHAPCHEVWVLDTRTWRGFHERNEKDIPDLLSGGGWDQLEQGSQDTSKLVIVVAPTNVIDLPATAAMSKWVGRILEPTHADYGDSWETQTEAFEHLLGNLTTNSFAKGDLRSLVILSGDVHYGFAARIHYRGHHPYQSPKQDGEIQAVMAHLTSSAFKNENVFTRFFHRWGYWPRLPWVWAWAGWHEKPQIHTSRIRGRLKAFFQRYRSRSLRNKPPLLNLANLPRGIEVSKRPDWRYRIDFLAGKHNPDSNMTKPKGTREGRDIVGVNNFGVVRFDWPDDPNGRKVLQELWWTNDSGEVAPRTLFTVSLGFEGELAPAIPELPVDSESKKKH